MYGDLIRPQVEQRHRPDRGEALSNTSKSRPAPDTRETTAGRSASYDTPRPRVSKLRLTIVAVLILVVAAVAVGGWYMYSSRQGNAAAVLFDNQKYQAVFLAGGQVYFGKLELVNDEYLKLSNVFYIQSDATGAKTDATNSKDGSMQLIKLGDEVHGPDDTMTINRDQVLFFEDLKSDGKVAQLIEKYRQGN